MCVRKLMYVLFLYPKVKYKFVQAHVYAVFGIQKSNIYLYKLMYVLFLLLKIQKDACPSSRVCCFCVQGNGA